MKRIVSNWSVIRALYLLGGILVIVESARTMQWMGVVLGAYFSIMGLFGIGCASGSCFQSSTDIKHSEIKEISDDIIFDEVK